MSYWSSLSVPPPPRSVPVYEYPMEATFLGQAGGMIHVQPLDGFPAAWVDTTHFNVTRVVVDGRPKKVNRKHVVLVTRKPKPLPRPFLGVSA